ncbi:dihydrofolate reductase family protein [Cypionkella sp.]|uniref:dihydrofolate reductase family protein n=1 Tax=Cypionkella sp. TaxID=2811411 RepID=UPI002ABB6AEF|nr:dihydrofolate reductase family protein [Cypionkella sp.]MDZ4395139.1 dihydrofolate reductase family protein [Cypionkella sp.]
MAKLVVSILSSLDGYCAGPGGRLDELPMGLAFDSHNLELMRGAGMFLFGATTYQMFEAYWTSVDRSPDGEPVGREISQRFEAGHRLVVSDRLVQSPASPWAQTEVVPRSRAHARIAEIKARPGGDLLIFGSHILANDLLAHGLIDEFHLLVADVVLGNGVRTFEPGLHGQFKLINQSQLADTDIAALHYECRPN